jgi:hypothetical protein
MNNDQLRLRPRLLVTTATLGLLALGGLAQAQESDRSFEIYGFAQADFIQDFNRVHPDWDATLRPSRIPTIDGLYGSDGQSIISARQSRFGVKATQNIAGKPLFVKFEFDLYGTGDDAGQTTMRLRHFYGSWGPVLAGQTNTVFMDGDIFPNTIDYWGPPGMVFIRNAQIRYTFETGPHTFAVAVEQPGNDVDPGYIRVFDPELGDAIQGNEQLPDLTAHYRYVGGWGHVQLAGILRQVGFDTADTVDNEPKGEETGWGVNLTSNIKVFKKDVIHLGVVYGEGIATYMNDGGMDLGPELSDSSPSGLEPAAVPLLGITAYYDHYWNDHWSSSIGYSETHVDNVGAQTPDTFEYGRYASANVLYTPDPRLMVGAEMLWGEREDLGGFSGEDVRLQVSFKYNFSSNDFR